MALRVREPFSVPVDGFMRVYNAGDLVDEKDPVVKGREALFEPVETAVRRGRVEQATAAPGEVREVAPAKKTTRGRRKDEASEPKDES